MSLCHEHVWDVEVELHAFLTLAQKEVSGQLRARAALFPEKELTTPTG